MRMGEERIPRKMEHIKIGENDIEEDPESSRR